MLLIWLGEGVLGELELGLGHSLKEILLTSRLGCMLPPLFY